MHLVKHSIDIDLHIDFEISKETTLVLLKIIFQWLNLMNVFQIFIACLTCLALFVMVRFDTALSLLQEWFETFPWVV